MPFLSRSDILATLRASLSHERAIDALLVVEGPDGREISRHGGIWSPGDCRYIEVPGRAAVPNRKRLSKAQVAPFRDFLEWLGKAKSGDDSRWPLLQLAGGRGSGKTYLAFGFISTIVALEFPGEQSFGTVLNTDNRRECQQHIAMVCNDDWITKFSTDTRDCYVEWITGHRVTWVSAQNPKKLRQAGLPIRAVYLNECHLMPERIGADAMSACRNLGGLVVPIFNPPTHDNGNWTARLWFAVEAGEVEGRQHLMLASENEYVNHSYLDKAGPIIRVISSEIAGADVDGIMRMSGKLAYPSFDARPYNLANPEAGGLLLEEIPRLGWTDVTPEITISSMGADASRGADYVIGCDFQRRPGVIGTVIKFYRVATRSCKFCGDGGCLVMVCDHSIAVRGVEPEFSQALFDHGFSPTGYSSDGRPSAMPLLIGDATGARQNADHQFNKSPSFAALQADGWIIKPPGYYNRLSGSGKSSNRPPVPWNPAQLESLAQMYELFSTHHVLLRPKCKDSPAPGFPSLVESFRNAPTWEATGKLRETGGWQHGPDTVRYPAWWKMPRPRATVSTLSGDIREMFRGLKSS